MRIRLPNIFSQQDSRWGSVMLGFNNTHPYNIHNYGCLITCLAMVVSYYVKAVDPITINEGLKDKNKFVSGGLYVWNGLETLYPEIEEIRTATPHFLFDHQMKEIFTALDSGFPVMLEIDYNPKDVDADMHFVLAIGYNPNDENDITIADPINGKTRSLKEYLGWFRPSARKTIESYTIFKGKVPQSGGVFDPSKITASELDSIAYPVKNFEGNIREVGFYFREWEVEKKIRLGLEKQIEINKFNNEKAIKEIISLINLVINKFQNFLK